MQYIDLTFGGKLLSLLKLIKKQFMKKKNQSKKKLALDKLQLTKINNPNKIFGGNGNAVGFFENTTGEDNPPIPTIRETVSDK